MQRFICAHELGHLILHPIKNTLYSVSKIEVEANIFAVELLVPDESLYGNNHAITTIHEAATVYGNF